MFLDEATITVQGGKGGDGLVSWRKEKYVPRGGPWGGDGGNGGNIIFRAAKDVDTLSHFAERKNFAAEDGIKGGKSNKRGRGGEDTILTVPPGTVITKAGTDEVVADLIKDGDEVIVAKGGRGGYGNAHFASSVRQAPDFAEMGEPGEEKQLKLELKLVADVGIIGLPSVGKSTLISVISAAKPKIADYPFTTLIPNLGVVKVHDRGFVVCDVPGLIEGASEGKGLGDQFLRHIERCGVLVHMLDVSRENLDEDYQTIRKELEAFSPTLSKKRELVALNKIDLVENVPEVSVEIFAEISAATRKGVDEFIKKLLPVVLEERKKREEEREEVIPVLRPHLESVRTDDFTIKEDPDGTFTIRGKRIEQIAKMTDWSNASAIHRFRDIIKRIGLKDALEKNGASDGSVVMVGEVDVSRCWM